MGFLQPMLLALGAAIAVPIILHLFQRHQGPRVIFPALRYLRRAERESARRIRLRQLLLMLLRVAALALIALAAARPFATGGRSGHEPTAVVMVLDNSMSTGLVADDRRVLDALKDRALETLERAGPDDRFWLIRAGEPGAGALAGNAFETEVRVRETEPTAAAADIPVAVARARSLLAAGADGRAPEIHLLSDLQATAFSNAVTADDGPPILVWSPAGDAAPNAAVSSVVVAGGLTPVAGQRSTVVARVSGQTEEDSVPLRLGIDERVVAAGTGPPGSEVVLSLSARSEGWLTGWVETDADALRADDRRYFATPVMPPPFVAVGGTLPFVEQALVAMADAGRIRRGEPSSADVVILPGGVGLESITGNRTAVVVPPATPLELPALNRRLADVGLPWRLEPTEQTGEARFATDESDDEVVHALERVRLASVYALVPQASPEDSVEALLRLQDGSPWAVTGVTSRGGRYILIASPLSLGASTLPTSAAMVPLLDRLVGAWAAASPIRTAYDAGAEIDVPESVDAVERPSGEVEPVSGARFRLGPEPGLYTFSAGASQVLTVGVNSPAAESDLTRIDEAGLRAALPGSELELHTRPGDWSDAVYTMRLGREIWWPLVLIGLILLVLESVIAAPGRGTARSTLSPPPVRAGSGPPGATTEPVAIEVDAR